MEHHKQPLLFRLFNKVEIIDPEGCWIWQSAKYPTGYGHIRFGKKSAYAHRVFYELIFGNIPEGKELDHLCRNPSCVNPFHLEAVTHQVNMQRGIWPGGRGFAAWAKKNTHCGRGHPMTDDNLYYRKSGKRACRACRKISHMKDHELHYQYHPRHK